MCLFFYFSENQMSSPIQINRGSLTFSQSNAFISSSVSAPTSAIYITNNSTLNISNSVFDTIVLQIQNYSSVELKNGSTFIGYLGLVDGILFTLDYICIGNITASGNSLITVAVSQPSVCSRNCIFFFFILIIKQCVIVILGIPRALSHLHVVE
jgi:hypothetical protein